VNLPLNPSSPNQTFDGWYTGKNGDGVEFTGATPVIKDIRVYAKWIINADSSFTLQDALTLLSTHAAEDGAYTVTLEGEQRLGITTLDYNGKEVSITLEGGAIIGLSSCSTGSFFTLEDGVTLQLEDITLQGRSGNKASLVRVNSGGMLVTKDGSMITGNPTSGTGGGVSVDNGTFAMSVGAVSGNTASKIGGGVYVEGSGTFTKLGGTIYGDDNNTHVAGDIENTVASGSGHAVYAGTSKQRNSTAGPRLEHG
jgi:uncharacterized repeat protein (TIGR02543 family)